MSSEKKFPYSPFIARLKNFSSCHLKFAFQQADDAPNPAYAGKSAPPRLAHMNANQICVEAPRK